MSPEEIERTFEFILQQEARAEVRHERIQTQLAGLADQQKALASEQKAFGKEMTVRDRRLSEKIEHLTDGIENLTSGMEKLTGGMEILKEASRDLIDHARWTDARLRRLEDPQG